MTINDSADLTRQLDGVLSLSVRRAGHAVMAHLLRELDRRGHAGPVPADLMSWHSGAIGEVVVGQELARLPLGWSVLHSVPVGRNADIDHLVIGPAGVFVLNTKRHPRKDVWIGTHAVRVDGTQVNGYQRNLLARAAEVGTLLGEVLDGIDAVRPVLVLADVADLRRSGVQTVEAVRAGGLVAHLLSLPPLLTAEQVRAVRTHAGRPRTWGLPASVLHEPDPTMRFLALESAPDPVRTPPPASVHRTRRAVARPHASATCRPDRRERAHRRALHLLLVLATAALAPIAALVGVGLFAAVTQALLAP